MGTKRGLPTIIELRRRRDEILEEAFLKNPSIQKLSMKLEAEKRKIINENQEAKALDDEIRRRLALKIESKNNYSRLQNKKHKSIFGPDRRHNK